MAKKIAAAEKEYASKNGKPFTEELFTQASSVLSSKSHEQETIELDYYGDRKASNPDNRRPLSPDLCTREQEGSSHFGGLMTGHHSKSGSSLITSCEPSTSLPTLGSQTPYDSTANSSILSSVQNDDQDEETEPERILSAFKESEINSD